MVAVAAGSAIDGFARAGEAQAGRRRVVGEDRSKDRTDKQPNTMADEGDNREKNRQSAE